MGLKYSNCLFYALIRLWKDGGYIIFRKTHALGGTFHTMWTKDFETIYQFVPLEGTTLTKTKSKLLVKILKLWFRGREKKWDLKKYHQKDPKWKILP